MSNKISKPFINLRDHLYFVRLILTSVFFSISSCSMGEEYDCLNFVGGSEENHVKDFLIYQNRSVDIGVYRLYSSSYDLNGDGDAEYFYFFETPWFCGMDLGCKLMIYEYKDNKFRELIEHGWLHLRIESKKEHDINKSHICVLSEMDEGWRRLSIKNKFEMQYLDGFYSAIYE